MKIIDGGVTSPKGYKACGGCAGIKKEGKDMAFIYSEENCVWSGTFTTNAVKAASIIRNMEILEKNKPLKGIVINSGNANACTAAEGLKNNETMAKKYAEALNTDVDYILTASTGVIGVNLPMDSVVFGIQKIAPALGSTKEDGSMAAQAIMTTDTCKKEVAVEIELKGKTVTIGGMCKGSGMIHPNMATMLSFITTDINIDKELLTKALKESVGITYNMISVDRDTSTNDMVIVMANGLSGNEIVSVEGEDYLKFKEALNFVNEKLAKDMAKDGEGATKLIEVNLKGADSFDQAKTVAKSVITSNLVKTAMFGEDANWGRVICAMGYSGADINPGIVDIDFKSAAGIVSMMKNGEPIVFDEDKAASVLKEDNIIIDIDLHKGESCARAWGCDLSYDYVRINGDYRS